MSLKPEEIALIESEQGVLKTTIESLQAQRSETRHKLADENRRARELTSEIHKTRRVEDKALLASDEAVAHGMAHKKSGDIKTLDRMLDRPYFARFEVEEQVRERTRKIEYKLGFAANSDCRIMDWRKAPVSKLFYDYQEGDEYAEEIQGQERSGRIALRHSLEISQGELRKISSKSGTFVRKENTWAKSNAAGSETHHQSGGLPHILSLITPDQFSLISEQAETPLLIQGIAGSGKTSVALHRLAYLLHEDNSDVAVEQCLFLVISQTLKHYISGTLPTIGIEGVRVCTFSEWVCSQIAQALPNLLEAPDTIRRPAERPSTSVSRALRSMAVLAELEEQATHSSNPIEVVLNTLAKTKILLERDESKLLDADLLTQCLRRAELIFQQNCLDRDFEALLLRALQIAQGGVRLIDRSIGKLGHIAADEIQDFTSCELACVVAAVKNPSDLTLVGDTSQGIDQASSFPGWDKLRKHWGFKDAITRFVSLQVSHRNTNEIMRLSEHVLQRPASKNSRSGRIPILFRCKDESAALKAAIAWLSQAQQRYPSALTCVITPAAEQARELSKLLRPTFGNALRLGSSEDFSFDQGLVVSDLTQVKGLEFMNVLIWNVSTAHYPSDQISRRKLYLAMTRASENLALVSCGTLSGILPQRASTLLRIVDQED